MKQGKPKKLPPSNTAAPSIKITSAIAAGLLGALSQVAPPMTFYRGRRSDQDGGSTRHDHVHGNKTARRIRSMTLR